MGKHKNENEPIRLSYQRGSHYNSIVDPYKATIGVGLGLPSYTPGLADKNLMTEAVSQSERFHVEQVCFDIVLCKVVSIDRTFQTCQKFIFEMYEKIWNFILLVEGN